MKTRIIHRTRLGFIQQQKDALHFIPSSPPDDVPYFIGFLGRHCSLSIILWPVNECSKISSLLDKSSASWRYVLVSFCISSYVSTLNVSATCLPTSSFWSYLSLVQHWTAGKSLVPSADLGILYGLTSSSH